MGKADLPPWLGARGGSASLERRGLARIAAGAALLAAGAAAGWLLHALPDPVACPPPPPQVTAICPPIAAPFAGSPRSSPPTARGRRPGRPPTTVALSALPPAPEMDEDARQDALRRFAQAKAPDLRTCVAEPDRGPVRRLGAAFEIDERGAVAAVQVLGAEGLPAPARQCASKLLASWTFPRDVLRGDESLIVNFVF